MALRDILKPGQSEKELRVQLPGEIKDRVDRGRTRTSHFAAKRNEAWEFWRNNPFAYLDAKNALKWLESGPAGVKKSGKDSWRSRLTRNIFRDVIEMEVSIATQRTPAFQVTPSTADPEKRSAAKLAQKVAFYGYDKWNLTTVRQDVVRHASVGDEGFAWPFWDSTVGPFVSDPNDPDGKRNIGMGEVGIRVFGANQVGWEEGVKFEDSPWHYVEYACPPQQIVDQPDYIQTGEKQELSPDAETEDLTRSRDSASKAKLVRVVEYLERPSARFPKGRWVTIANSRVVAGKRVDDDGVSWRAYPCAEYGYTGLALHYLPFWRDSDSDRAQGLGRDLIDPMRTFLDCLNRLIEWKNLALNPQTVGTPNILKGQRITDEPGKHYQIPNPKENWQWREVPAIPRELFEIMDRSESDMRGMAAQNDVGAETDSATEAQLLSGRNMTKRDSFFKALAKFDSQVMRHCLTLVQHHYDEERVLQVKGVAGWEPIEDFRGASLRDEVDVRVSPDSIVPTTRDQIQAKIFAYADRGWISRERAMQALEENTADGLISDLENDAGRVNRIILAIQQGEEALYDEERFPVLVGPDLEMDPATGQPVVDMNGQARPMVRAGWMPRPFDNTTVHRYYVETFMKSQEFERLDPGMQGATFEYYNALLDQEAANAARQAQMQTAMAEEQGRENAARPQGEPKASPDKPQPSPGIVPSPNQPADQQPALTS